MTPLMEVVNRLHAGSTITLAFILLLLTSNAVPSTFGHPASGSSEPMQSSGGTGSAYLYTLSVTSDSDSTTLNFTGGPKVLDYSASVVRGEQTGGFSYIAQPDFVAISQGASYGTIAEIQVQLLAIAGTVSGIATISIGNAGSTNVTLSFYNSTESQPFSSFGDIAPGGSSTSTRNFTIDYSPLYANPSDSISEQPIPTSIYHKVMAFYYPWYGNPAGPSGQWYHWVNATQDSIASATDYPLFGAYDSQDQAIITAQILMAREAGIDGFISSWWGIGTFEDHSLSVLLSVAQQMNFTVSVYYETVRNLTATDMVNELTYIVRQYGSNPAFLKEDGRPVIFVYDVNAYGRNATFWLDVRERLESNVGKVYLIGGDGGPNWLSYLNVFDGFHSYVKLSPMLMNGTYNYFTTNMDLGLPGLSWNEALNLISLETPLPVEQKALFFTVIPGMNRTGAYLTGEGPLIVVSRQNGKTYAQYWGNAISSNATGVLITSWNEWHEGTELEPSLQYGFSYLQLTRYWVHKYTQKPEPSVGLPDVQTSVSPPVVSRLPGDLEANFTLTNCGSAPALYTSLTITSGQNLSLTGVTHPGVYLYEENESSDLYSATIPLIMPNTSVSFGVSFALPSDKGTISVATNSFNSGGSSSGTAVSNWELSVMSATRSTTASTTSSSATNSNVSTGTIIIATTSQTMRTTSTALTTYISSSSVSSSSSSAMIADVPEFSYLPVVTIALVSVIILAHILIRRRSGQGVPSSTVTH